MLPAQPNQSLIDGLACLQQLASQREAVGGRELARQLGMESTRVNRLLRTLAHLGLAQQDDSRKYRTGPGIHVLAAQAMFSSGLLRRAMPHLEALRRFNCVVAMGVLWRDRVCYLYHASPQTPPGEALGRVGLYPVIHSGIGCALLAAETNAEVKARLKGLYSPSEIADLLDRLADYRESGYAVVDQPESRGNHGYGVAIGDQPAAAIGVSGRFTKRVESQAVTALRQAASAIAARDTHEAIA